MLKKMLLVLMTFVLLLSFGGCIPQTFAVGNGAKGNQVEETKQWYVLWGLVPINKIDTREMAKGSTDYTIHTEDTFVDLVINFVVGSVSVRARTVTVTR